MALLKQGNFINVGAASFQERKLLPFSHVHSIPKADSPFLALRSFASPKMITHVNRSSYHQDSETNMFNIEAIICPESVEAVSLALSKMGIQVTITDVWGGFGIHIVPDHPDDNMVYAHNRKIDMMVDSNKVKSVVDAIIQASHIEWPIGDYKSLYVMPVGLRNDSAFVYKVETTLSPFPVQERNYISGMSKLGLDGAYFSDSADWANSLSQIVALYGLNSDDLYGNFSEYQFRMPIRLGCFVVSSKVAHIKRMFKLLGSEKITERPVSDALVIRREFDRRILDVRFAQEGIFDLQYTEQSRDSPQMIRKVLE